MSTTVYTDGACLGNPGPGGWAWAVPEGPYAAGPDPATTNQRMEIRAALEAVRSLDGPLEVVSDSTYVVNCFRDRWWEGWLRRGWVNSQKKPVANRDLWEPLIDEYRADPTRVRFRWVKGHATDPYNDLVDRLAVEAARTQQAAAGVGAPTVLPAADAPGPKVPAGRRLVVGGDRSFGETTYGRKLREVFEAKASMHDDLVVLSGMGLGAEQVGAAAAVELGIPLVAVLAYPEQEAHWPMSTRERFRALLDAAREQVVLQHKAPTTKQQAGAALSRRDAWLARHADEALLVWDGEDDFVGRLVRSFRDHLGDDEVWVLPPAQLGSRAVRVGVDTGGTFTDVVGDDGRIRKVPSTPADPAEAVVAGIGELGESVDVLAHGTTVATNALLERRGARVALVTNEGFADVIEIGRQDRPSLYDLWADRPESLVPRELRFEAGGRLDARGQEVEPVRVPVLPGDVDHVAVCLLHSDLNPAHEQEVARVLRERGHEVTVSSDVSPEFREYERTVTTVVDTYLRPACRPYLLGLPERAAPEVLVMTSAGGLVPVEQAADRPASLLLSGPAGGVRAAAAAAVAAGFPDAVTFDMGGTSTDVCLVVDGRPAPAAQRSVAGFPIRLPALDVHTIGAGGGSVARLDPGGALVVGPQSAGAVPGPACYGRGGTEPTVTDADLVVGRIPSRHAFPGLGSLDTAAARAALDAAGTSAEGVIAVVDSAMVQAVRVVSVERGVDPRTLALVAFGGAGPLHACAIADALEMPAVVVPPRAGVLSAVGMLGAPRQVDIVRSWPTPSDHEALSQGRFHLARAAARRLMGLAADTPARVALAAGTGTAGVVLPDGTHVEVELSVDCRYAGQSHELTVPTVAEFEEEHRRRNGFSRPGAAVEVVAVRASARLASPVDVDKLPPPEGPARRPAVGPAVLAEPDCTVWLPEGWTAEVGGGGSWILRRSRS